MRSDPTHPTPRHPSTVAAAIGTLLLFHLGPAAHALCGDVAPPGAAPLEAAKAVRVAVLTFDAAWSADGAEEILEALASRGVRATFFLAGRFVRVQPALARRIAEAGHEMGNHTFRHAHLTRAAADGSRPTHPDLTRAAFSDEMEEARRAIESAAARPIAPLWRAPYGETNEELISWALGAGYRHVGWTEGLDALDWVGDPSSRLYLPPRAAAERILRRLAERPAASPPAIILMHLGSTRPPGRRFGEALPILIDGARRLGYRLLTAGEALGSEGAP